MLRCRLGPATYQPPYSPLHVNRDVPTNCRPPHNITSLFSNRVPSLPTRHLTVVLSLSLTPSFCLSVSLSLCGLRDPGSIAGSMSFHELDSKTTYLSDGSLSANRTWSTTVV
ncbi:hypothetical protein KP509_18G048300 [Ceratopteris richardii]|uniref:Uncharacterized protein n=1 Tax=Ceratopteris richardii TaxID=49495 RepID=A0A8T2SQ59_CERRI|nr:hypothetical protein KP509_18G048300 [Ceratopteris richardii]